MEYAIAYEIFRGRLEDSIFVKIFAADHHSSTGARRDWGEWHTGGNHIERIAVSRRLILDVANVECRWAEKWVGAAVWAECEYGRDVVGFAVEVHIPDEHSERAHRPVWRHAVHGCAVWFEAVDRVAYGSEAWYRRSVVDGADIDGGLVVAEDPYWIKRDVEPVRVATKSKITATWDRVENGDCSSRRVDPVYGSRNRIRAARNCKQISIESAAKRGR